MDPKSVDSPKEADLVSKEKTSKRKFDSSKEKRGKGNKRRNLGRKDYFRSAPDKRARNDAEKARRQESDAAENVDRISKPSVLPKAFAQEEIDAEEKRPKRKVAVMIGYSGSGYKGMQISRTERTIEGDLFTAFIKAGAISKANADDPKKSSLARCARTDKGVHAAGNVISLKLIVEDEDIVKKINDQLSPQIRVWGIERTINSFSCYQACDSRWYEYLIPTHCLLPPHPRSFLGRKLVELATEVGDLDEYQKRQEDVAGFWERVDNENIKPLLDELDDTIRASVEKLCYEVDYFSEADKQTGVSTLDIRQPNQGDAKTSDPENSTEPPKTTDSSDKVPLGTSIDNVASKNQKEDETGAINNAVKAVKQAYLAAKKTYRISSTRRAQLESALSQYVGTKNFFNFTVKKSFKDSSAKRHIKSFTVTGDPILIDGTEWLSLKVHGQSFMMHQIRKMVGMAALVVRCGCVPSRIKDAFENQEFIIPKAPGLGLLLERPIFDSYNERILEKLDRDPINFAKHKEEMEEFKDREIYQRIYREEEERNEFHGFFAHIDHYKDPGFLYLSSKGISATKGATRSNIKSTEIDSEDDMDGGEG